MEQDISAEQLSALPAEQATIIGETTNIKFAPPPDAKVLAEFEGEGSEEWSAKSPLKNVPEGAQLAAKRCMIPLRPDGKPAGKARCLWTIRGERKIIGVWSKY